jgi:hypothetical protein
MSDQSTPVSILSHAVRNDDAARVEALLRQGADPLERNARGITLLTAAIIAGERAARTRPASTSVRLFATAQAKIAAVFIAHAAPLPPDSFPLIEAVAAHMRINLVRDPPMDANAGDYAFALALAVWRNDAANYGLGPNELVAWCDATRADFSLGVIGAGFDFLELAFPPPITDAEALSRRLAALCPDLQSAPMTRTASPPSPANWSRRGASSCGGTDISSRPSPPEHRIRQPQRHHRHVGDDHQHRQQQDQERQDPAHHLADRRRRNR